MPTNPERRVQSRFKPSWVKHPRKSFSTLSNSRIDGTLPISTYDMYPKVLICFQHSLLSCTAKENHLSNLSGRCYASRWGVNINALDRGAGSCLWTMLRYAYSNIFQANPREAADLIFSLGSTIIPPKCNPVTMKASSCRKGTCQSEENCWQSPSDFLGSPKKIPRVKRNVHGWCLKSGLEGKSNDNKAPCWPKRPENCQVASDCKSIEPWWHKRSWGCWWLEEFVLFKQRWRGLRNVGL